MSTKKVLIANWKLNHIPSDTQDFCDSFINKTTQLLDNDTSVVIAPTFLCLETLTQALQNTSIQVAAQNCYYKDEGAFTGEVSALHLSKIGCSYVIIGHSERRQLFHEINEEIAFKNKACVTHNMIPIFCVGESFQDRENNNWEDVIKVQILEGLTYLDLTKQNIIIAYEPVWAIGTGKVATEEQIQEVHKFIYKLLETTFSRNVAQDTTLIYGGSVKPENCKTIMALEHVNGLLIGGASLKVESFSKIIQNINL